MSINTQDMKKYYLVIIKKCKITHNNHKSQLKTAPRHNTQHNYTINMQPTTSMQQPMEKEKETKKEIALTTDRGQLIWFAAKYIYFGTIQKSKINKYLLEVSIL